VWPMRSELVRPSLREHYSRKRNQWTLELLPMAK
jgi:hypothetical protein